MKKDIKCKTEYWAVNCKCKRCTEHRQRYINLMISQIWLDTLKINVKEGDK